MQAHVARSHLPTETAERWMEELGRRIVPSTAAAEGFLAGAWLADLEAEEAVVLALRDADASEPDLEGDAERCSVLAFAGRLGGAWCLVHALEGDALPSVLESAVDRAVASSGNVGAVGLVAPDGRSGAVYAFTDQRPPEGHGGRLYRVLAAA